ncbi:L,D-transpeptidase family protein [Thalassospira marina]|uniref:L,D-TPase catalytic domain-containing protein n=1 Tax=Thalassospira marina TaxID=2048283 RepID=A0ABM6QDG5_9PROT|nr:L,D-transpeptidase family protein [Thalassospira marina]AUG54633.1 hypothetical protein CSC3H3_19355 [Thalassospira marina]
MADRKSPNPENPDNTTAAITVDETGTLHFQDKNYRAAIGKTGMSLDKREGDGASPIGNWTLRYVMYRADRVPAPKTGLPVHILAPDDGWCDAPSSSHYNRPVRLPLDASHEKLWREDAVYDVIVALDHNDSPAVPGNGSAIFMHIARPAYNGTEGCIALSRADLYEILAGCGVSTRLCIRSTQPGGDEQTLAANRPTP